MELCEKYNTEVVHVNFLKESERIFPSVKDSDFRERHRELTYYIKKRCMYASSSSTLKQDVSCSIIGKVSLSCSISDMCCYECMKKERLACPHAHSYCKGF